MGRWNPKIHDNTTTRHTFNTNQEVTDKHKDKNLTNTGHYIPLGLLTGDVSSTDNKTFTMWTQNLSFIPAEKRKG